MKGTAQDKIDELLISGKITFDMYMGFKGVVCGLEGIRLADRCILSKLE
jgi:hypothetical protein